MYKGASAKLQHRHRVNAPLPTGGYIGMARADDDFIPSAGNMDLEECRDELRQLGVELARAENELAVVKRDGRSAVPLGHRTQSIVQRRSVIKTRMRTLLADDRKNDASEILAQAVREVASDETQKAIFMRAKALHKARMA